MSWKWNVNSLIFLDWFIYTVFLICNSCSIHWILYQMCKLIYINKSGLGKDEVLPYYGVIWHDVIIKYQINRIWWSLLFSKLYGKTHSVEYSPFFPFDKKIFEFHAVKDKDQLTSKPTNFTYCYFYHSHQIINDIKYLFGKISDHRWLWKRIC